MVMVEKGIPVMKFQWPDVFKPWQWAVFVIVMLALLAFGLYLDYKIVHFYMWISNS
jgi:hypothetical protein